MATDIRLKEDLPEITEALVATYTECSRLNHLGHQPLPSREAMGDVLADLADVLYPGYARRQNLHIGNVEYYVGELIDGLHDKLTQQIARALRHEADCGQDAEHYAENGRDFEALAQQKAIAFLSRLPDLRMVLEDDVRAAYEGDPAAKSHYEIVFCYPGLEAITIYRLAHEMVSLGVPLLPRIMTEAAHSKTGIDIHPGANIGPGFFIDHGTGVVIGETCDIGRNVKLYQGVTLGALSFPRDGQGQLVRGKKRHPTLEDEVVVYANATILGGETVIGHHAVIGSNVWLTHSVAPNTRVVMEEPTLRMRRPEDRDGELMYHI
ncbi:MAG TPA: serine O-acetyltransferase EpsC [Gemmataceae bacterium]|jgi:serine O-acetyltransferase|nr:serine O-acetyltransferase EpsC [Gemmataceae bacterium]